MQRESFLSLAACCLATVVPGGPADAAGSTGAGGGAAANQTATPIGVNLTSAGWASGQRAFANLVVGGPWVLAGNAVPPAADVTSDGGVAYVPAGNNAVFYLTPPNAPSGVTVNCTWQGSATVSLQSNGTTSNVTTGANYLRFTWTNDWSKSPAAWLRISKIVQPVRFIDCRETTMAAGAVFDPAFVQSLQGFKMIRFMDWQLTNPNYAVAWANRNLPTTVSVGTGDGVPVENMMVLVNAVGADPWFCVPWNASVQYIQNFAQYVHDNLPADHKVYVEVSNEVWNIAFRVGLQARQEGLSEGLSSNATTANLYRYAEKTTQVMKIWSAVFADRPASLVRVASSQQVVPARADAILGYKNTAASVDALATSAYFGGDVMAEGQTTDPTVIFSRLGNRVSTITALALQNKAIATKYGKAYIAYEGGQSISIPYNVPLLASIERDSRMHDTYIKFVDSWKSQVGGALGLFANVGNISTSGAWGMLEHSAQPLTAAPKMRAVTEELAAQ